MTTDATTQENPETPAEPGSIPLVNARWEKFAHRLSWGVSQAKSYVIAGFPEGESNATNASKLAKKQPVADRVNWLKQKIAEAHIYDGTKIEERLAYMADALSEIVIDPDTGLRKGGPMFNPTAAARVLELLGRKHGIFKDRIELGGQVAVGNTDMLRRMKPEQRSAFKQMLLEVREQAPVADNDDSPEDVPQGGVVPVAK